MRIPRIYEPKLSPQATVSEVITLDDFGGHHVAKVLRLQIGAQLRVFDGAGTEFLATIDNVGKSTSVRLEEKLEIKRESPLTVELLQVISRGDRMDFTIQKAVELGISKIVPLTSERCGVKLDPARAQKKIESYQKIAISACEQCGRNVIPEVTPLISLDSYLNQLAPSAPAPAAAVSTANATTASETTAATVSAAPADAASPDNAGSAAPHFINLTLDPLATHKVTTLPSTGHYRLLIGPEGGLSASEIAKAASAGFIGVSLGPRILRTETAALVTLSILGAHFGDL